MAVLTGASSVDSFITRFPCKPAFRSPDSCTTGTRFWHADHPCSKSAPTVANSRWKSIRPLKLLLPSAAARSAAAEPESNSEDGSQVGEQPISAESSISSDDQSGSQAASEKVKMDMAQSAFERAATYKKLKSVGPSTDLPSQSRPRASPPPRPVSGVPEVEIIRGSQTVEPRMERASSSPLPPAEVTRSPPLASSSPQTADEGSSDDLGETLAEKALDVERIIEERITTSAESGEEAPEPAAEERQDSKALSAIERARAYREQRAEMVAALKGYESASKGSDTSGSSPSSTSSGSAKSEDKVLEIEIITREGVIKRKVMNPQEQVRAFSNTKDIKRKGVSALDFAGLGFADKKTGRQQPAGLSETPVSPPTGPLPEVQIITRDAGIPQAEGSEQPGFYKPKVSTWGIFARPADFSKTYGGGRTIRPGESLETDEEMKRREARTQKLLVEYRKRMGLDVDPKIKAETEKVLKQANSLMDRGRLRDALMLYELAMRKMPAQSELHGLAALQAAVCLDSLSRSSAAPKIPISVAAVVS